MFWGKSCLVDLLDVGVTSPDNDMGNAVGLGNQPGGISADLAFLAHAGDGGWRIIFQPFGVRTGVADKPGVPRAFPLDIVRFALGHRRAG